MRLNVSAWAIRKPIPSLVLFLVLMVLGLVSFRALPITRFPNIDIPIVSVTITQSGAAPAELQTQVTKWVEDSVAGVKGVKHILSTISEGSSITTIEFRLEVNQDRAVNDVKDAISKIRINLPRTIDEPIISRVEIAGLPIMIYGASAPAMAPEIWPTMFGTLALATATRYGDSRPITTSGKLTAFWTLPCSR